MRRIFCDQRGLPTRVWYNRPALSGSSGMNTNHEGFFRFCTDPVKATKNMLFAIEPYWWCPHGLALVGTHGDGVKWTCGLGLLATRPPRARDAHAVANNTANARRGAIGGDRGALLPPPPCVVYSAGSSGDTKFEAELRARTACEIHIFDPHGSASGYAQNDWSGA